MFGRIGDSWDGDGEHEPEISIVFVGKNEEPNFISLPQLPWQLVALKYEGEVETSWILSRSRLTCCASICDLG